MLSEAPEGMDALVLADLARLTDRTLVHIARDEPRAAAMAEALCFFNPDLKIWRFPAWDCLPYDRISPRSDILGRRMATLHDLASGLLANHESAVLLTTMNAVMQRLPPRSVVTGASWSARIGNQIDSELLTQFLDANGYIRTDTVREAGDFAIRGGVIDLYPPGADWPVRLDLFGSTLDSLRRFDPGTQRSTEQISEIRLLPVNEVLLSRQAVSRFRTGYVTAFGAVTREDPLYHAVSEMRRYPGMEHWLPLFYEQIETLFDYIPEYSLISLDYLAQEAARARWDMIADHYEARREGEGARSLKTPAYKALPPERLFLKPEEWEQRLEGFPTRFFNAFAASDGMPGEEGGTIAGSGGGARTISMGGRAGRSFAAERAQKNTNVFNALTDYIKTLHEGGKRVVIAVWSLGARERFMAVLEDHGVSDVRAAESWPDVLEAPKNTISCIVLGLEAGFETPDTAVLSEQDILGDRFVRKTKSSRQGRDVIEEWSQLSQGELVVHNDHGIGRFEGLHTIEVSGAPHDCLLIIYREGDRLYLPVENIDLISRYGSAGDDTLLDRLGGVGWQARTARLKKHLLEMAEELMKVAAARSLQHAPVLEKDHGGYEEFCARFPFEETEDQLRSMEQTLEDMRSGRPMDRLVCGDVGFGKTEVALRAAFVAAMSGGQVAIITPTTLLCRQHYQTFVERFQGFPFEIRQLSRLVPLQERTRTQEDMAKGTVDIIIGTHALLSKKCKFRSLHLLVIDEEQHFGVRHKEQLKNLRANVHVLTLTATPLPRTLQLALSGVRDMSLISKPPVDRLSVRSFIAPFDPVTIREVLLREHYRGGQSFYVCPRIRDLADVEKFITENIPEVKVALTHGQMTPAMLEDRVTAFYEGRCDVLLSTNIIESGLDIPTANTLIVHRADLFGLGQLHQLRGRVGRSKLRAYAYFMAPVEALMSANAEKRLQALQRFDSLGAGFNLASHDLDIRGAGNLLGDAQSGHIREVGVELYQEMLEQAIASLQEGGELSAEEPWSPQINIGVSVLIPEQYIPDLNSRMTLYRRLVRLESLEELEQFEIEMIDRFGLLPEETQHLLKIITLKLICRQGGIDKIDAGPKGVVIGFHNDSYANPAGLVAWLSQAGEGAKLRADHRLIIPGKWETPEERFTAIREIAENLSSIARAA